MSEKFDPNAHMIALEGKQYLPVAARVAWMRSEHPDWQLLTTELYADEELGIYRVECLLKDGAGNPIAAGRGREDVGAFRKGPYEKAETIAVGRALAFAGYGTLESLELSEDGGDKIADVPAEKPSAGGGQCRHCGMEFTAAQAEYAKLKLGGLCGKCFNWLNDDLPKKAEMATQKQLGLLHKLWAQKGFADAGMRQVLKARTHKTSNKELTKREASELIEWLNEQEDAEEEA